MFKLALDAGHSINTAGKRCMKSIDPNETREWVLNDRICRYIEDGLKGYEAEVIRLDDRTGQRDVPRLERCNTANRLKADFLLSEHHNAGIKGQSGGGVVVYMHTNDKEPIISYRKQIYDKLIKHTGLKGNRSQPLNSANFDMVNFPTMPALLIENGFMDSVVDVPIILTDVFARKSATAQVEFLVETFGIKKKGSSEVNTINYTIVSGDNLSKIADKFNTTWQELQKINNIVNPSLIQPGQIIKVPKAVPVPVKTLDQIKIEALDKTIAQQKQAIIDQQSVINKLNASLLILQNKIKKAVDALK